MNGVMVIEQAINAFILLLIPILIAFLGFNLCRKCLSSTIAKSKAARRIHSIFGLIGTPIHELSHLGVALIFGHKIQSVKLFAWNSDAYVIHIYNPRSTIHVIGNFFTAIAPFITSVWLIHYLSPNDFISVQLNENPVRTIQSILVSIPSIMSNFVLVSNWWELSLAVMISFYCVPSNSDFKNALKSIVISLPILILLLILSVLFFDISQLIGTVFVVSLFSSMISVIGWCFLGIIAVMTSNNQN